MSRPVCVHRTGRRTEIAYKVRSPDKSAQHDEVLGLRRYGKWRGCTVEVHVLIRGDLFAMRDVAFLVKLPAGATGTQMSRHLLEGLSHGEEIRT